MTVFSVRITVFSLDMSNVENFYSPNDFCGERVGVGTKCAGTNGDEYEP